MTTVKEQFGLKKKGMWTLCSPEITTSVLSVHKLFHLHHNMQYLEVTVTSITAVHTVTSSDK